MRRQDVPNETSRAGNCWIRPKKGQNMRKRLLIGVWLLIPIVLLAVHYGPGQRGTARDRAAEQLALAQAAEKTEAWADAMQHYADALATLPSTDVKQRYQVRLAAAKARLYSGEL